MIDGKKLFQARETDREEGTEGEGISRGGERAKIPNSFHFHFHSPPNRIPSLRLHSRSTSASLCLGCP
ncbi:hypothetical protein MLD38_001477 [Melastoma candidum]|uniref:Uncharacterized protein n=1 Tax=Melastoma candidum TaxID=119954 RepID=A0ACB9SDT4_9MYRT|nr:hypothetical protein MLD38_001477 [Melastoma candidum]